METKKTKSASLQGMQTLYFLIGLNMVLLTVWYLFGMQTFEMNKIDYTEVSNVEKEPEVIYVIEEPQPEMIEPEIPETLPEPDVFETVEEVPEVTVKPNMPDDIVKIPLPTTTGESKPAPKVDLRSIQDKVNNFKETVLEPMSAAEVTKMAIYPGCEKYTSKKDLVQCFSEKLGHDIIRELDKNYPEVDKDMVGAKFAFHVNTEGEIVDIKTIGGDKEFEAQAKDAFNKVASKLKRKGKLIQPAKMNTGDKAILKFNNKVWLQRPN